MLHTLFLALRERHWNRDRRRRIAQMLELERALGNPVCHWSEAMATQLAEIRTLPEVSEQR